MSGSEHDQFCVSLTRGGKCIVSASVCLNPQHTAFLDELLLITKRLDQFFAEKDEKMHTPEYAAQAAEDFRTTWSGGYHRPATRLGRYAANFGTTSMER